MGQKNTSNRSAAAARKQRFAEAYAASGNGREAARAAGFTGTPASLDVTASRLLKDATVAKVLSALREEIAKADAERAKAQADADAKAQKTKIADLAERREILTGMARKFQRKSPIAAAKAIDTLNKMDGVYLTKHADPDGKPLAFPPTASFAFTVQQIPGSENRT